MNLCKYLIIAVLFISMKVEAQSDANYLLGTGDTISIRVHGESDLTFDTKIGLEGTILYPFLGEIEVEGRTVADVRWIISQGLKGDYLLNPEVDVSVAIYRPFFILGEVKDPKNYPYQPGLTVSQAIAIAGGFTERAAKENFELKRKNEEGKLLVSKIKMDDKVLPGDIITVSESFF